MASIGQQFGGLKCPPISTFKKKKLTNYKSHYSLLPSKRSVISAAAAAAAVKNAEERERMKLKDMFEEAYERCLTAPTDGVSFTVEDFHAALEKYDFTSEIVTKVKGTVFNMEEAGIVPGLREEFIIIGENEADDSLILSLRATQYELAWERCRQLQAEDVVIRGNCD